MNSERNYDARRSPLVWASCLLISSLFASSTAHAYKLKTTRTGNRVRWSEAVVTLYVDEKLEQFYGKEAVRSSLSMAADAWRGLPNTPDIVISDKAAPGYESAQRTNGIYLMDPWPFPKEQLAVTVSTYDLDGKMIGADVLVNAESAFAVLPDGEDHPGMVAHDLPSVLTHEFGHVLGLDESPTDQMATMWPYIRGGDVHQRTLTDDDEQGVTDAYRGATLEASTAANSGCSQASVVGLRAPVSKLQLAGLVLGVVWMGRRRAVRRARA
jgi:hypothetical protein